MPEDYQTGPSAWENAASGSAMNDVLAIILGGGRGTRLFPLTFQRSKPAVPIGGKYRLIDIPVSNCLNSNLRRIYVLTQYNSESLNKHVSSTYKFDMFSSGYVTVLAAEQTEDSPEWFQGTADAVRQSLRHFRSQHWRETLILSGDQLYQMDYRRMIETHRRHVADATVAVLPVSAEQAPGFGILKVNKQGRIVHFEEKPKADRLPDLVSEIPGHGPGYLASMGIYVFSRDALHRSLQDPTLIDFGRHVIPRALAEMRVQAHHFRGYWEDVGTIGSYFQANLALCEPIPPFDFYDANRPVYTHPRLLPATKIESCTVRRSLVSEGCILIGAEIEHSLVGIRARIGRGTQVRNSLVLGADFYETVDEIEHSGDRGVPPLGIGAESVIQNAIVDKNARIGSGVRILNEAGEREKDGPGYYIRDGIVIVPKAAVIPDGTVI
jgi:glucose-1-phosphate adenylyltransferase